MNKIGGEAMAVTVAMVPSKVFVHLLKMMRPSWYPMADGADGDGVVKK